MPAWAQFFVRTGWWIGARPQGSKLSGVLVAPVNALAVPLLSLGALFARFVSDPWSSSDSEEHARLIESLPEGTPVAVRSVTKIYKGIYVDKRSDGRFRVKVESSPHNTTLCIERDRALDIQPRPGGDTKLPKTQSGRTASSNSLIRDLLGAAGYALLLGARTEIALVGAKSRLEREFTGLSARLHRSSSSLQELVRVRAFGGTDGHYASDWFSTPPATTLGSPFLSIFATSRDYLRASPSVTAGNCILLTEAADERVGEAIARLEELARMTAASTVKVDVPKQPGVGLWLYEFPS